ncbi:hypothetical protein PHYSODRAFT_248639 [Phytophthora sojae]|uniref:Uncharacterized protein n=1 Tax=Phytophthora sojae (strain P6497) TaxID=1094619 RepID=G4ZR68_PHYSP|nr:hypothetical protein PHYSODRAFT_248639 [Phytophthora sojae]EGZ14290.1 hypothetical protein PHYSODRAFT_248639 [Phytophthora sojae]|eukprot:XP_009531719.1 hypothetical protein PHYSODRAFT_248639 [Phytophthora sojae]
MSAASTPVEVLPAWISLHLLTVVRCLSGSATPREHSSVGRKRAVLRMCVYLAPRWRRRSLLATLMLALTLLLTADAARALRTSSVETQHQAGSTTGSGSAAVNEVQVGDVDAGVVTTDTTQSSTTFTKKTWGAGSHSDASKKSVSFSSLVQTTATVAPSGERSIEEPKSASGSMDNEVGTPSATTKAKGTTSAKQDDDDSDESFDLQSDDDSADSGSDSENHDKTTGKTGTSNKSTPAPTPTPTPTPTSASQQTTYPPQPTHPGSIDAKTLSWSEPTMYPQTTQPVSNVIATTTPSTGSSASGSASGQPVQGQSYQVSGSAKSAEAFEKSTKSAASTTDSRSLDETLVVVIVGVVGAIGALLMFVSRKVLQETGDDEDMADSSFF